MLATKKATKEQLIETLHNRLLEDVYVSQQGYVLAVVGTHQLFWARVIQGPYHEQKVNGGSFTGSNRSLSMQGFKVTTDDKSATISVDGSNDVIDTYNIDEEQHKASVQAIFSSTDDNICNVWLFSSDYRRPEYLFKCPSTGEFVVTTSPALMYSYDFDVYKGLSGDMKKMQGRINVQRDRDGGTTSVDCVRGNWGFFSPSNASKSPTIRYGLKTYKLEQIDTPNITDYCESVLKMDVSMWTEPTLRATPLTPV